MNLADGTRYMDFWWPGSNQGRDVISLQSLPQFSCRRGGDTFSFKLFTNGTSTPCDEW